MVEKKGLRKKTLIRSRSFTTMTAWQISKMATWEAKEEEDGRNTRAGKDWTPITAAMTSSTEEEEVMTELKMGRRMTLRNFRLPIPPPPPPPSTAASTPATPTSIESSRATSSARRGTGTLRAPCPRTRTPVRTARRPSARGPI